MVSDMSAYVPKHRNDAAYMAADDIVRAPFHRHVDMALAFARSHKFDESLVAHVAAVIISGGRVLSIGYNSRSNSGLQAAYKTNPNCTSIHAEVDAILNVRRKINLRGSRVVVVRKLLNDRENNPLVALARPCPMCEAVLHSYGVKRAMYTIDNGAYGIMRVTDPREAR